MIKKYKSEIMIFFLAAFLRLIAFVIILSFAQAYHFPFPHIGSDSRNYLQGAESIRIGDGYQYRDGTPIHYFLPGYPIFIALITGIVGSLYLVIFVQVLLASLTAVLIYRLGKKWSHNVGLTAALFFSIDPSGLFYSNVILSETLFLFLVSILLLALTSSKIQTPGKIFFSGLLFGALIMVRPLAIAFAPGLLFFFISKKENVQRLRFITLFFLATALVVGSWIIRNKIQFDSYELSQTFSTQLFDAHAPQFYAFKNGISTREAVEILNQKLETISPYGRERSDRNGAYQKKVALEYLAEYPIQFTFFHLMKTSPNFISDGFRDLGERLYIIRSSPSIVELFTDRKIAFEHRTLLIFVVLGIIIWSIISLLALLGVIFGRKDALVLFLFLLLVFPALLAGGAVSHPRYRHGTSPLLFLLASYGLWNLIMLQKKRKQS